MKFIEAYDIIKIEDKEIMSMEYSNFSDLKLSRLGFGAMRLPSAPDGAVDVELTEKMIDTAIKSGVNYFDTAWPYHSGMSESIVGKILSKYRRNSRFK